MDAERKLISLQVKYDTLEKTHFTVKQQMKKMKVGCLQCVCVCGGGEVGKGFSIVTVLYVQWYSTMATCYPLFVVHKTKIFTAPLPSMPPPPPPPQAEMSALLCQYSSTSADASHAQRLQQALEQSKSETQTLLNKLHKLERQQVGRGGYACVCGRGGGEGRGGDRGKANTSGERWNVSHFDSKTTNILSLCSLTWNPSRSRNTWQPSQTLGISESTFSSWKRS